MGAIWYAKAHDERKYAEAQFTSLAGNFFEFGDEEGFHVIVRQDAPGKFNLRVKTGIPPSRKPLFSIL